MTQWEESPSDRLQRLLDEEDQKDLTYLQWNDAICIIGAALITLLVVVLFC